MHSVENLGPKIVFRFGDSGVFITETVILMWVVMAVMILGAFLFTRRMEKVPRGRQVIAELIVSGMSSLTSATMGKKHEQAYSPYICTLLIFLVLANALGLFGFRPVTADVNTTFAMAILSFLIIHGSSMKRRGVGGFFKHLGSPYPFMFPINLVTEIALPISLAFRLFGNILGGAIIMALAFQGLEAISANIGLPIPFLDLILPIPLNLFFDVFEPLLQGFIFTMLTMVFTANAMAGSEDH